MQEIYIKIKKFAREHPFIFFFLLSFMLRAFLVTVFPLPDLSGSDFPFYRDVALKYVNEGVFGDVNYLAPGWPLFLAFLYQLFGQSLLVNVLGQIIIGSFFVSGIYLLGKEVFNDKVGFVSAFAALLWPTFLIETFIYGNSFLFFSTLLLYSLLFFLWSIRGNLHFSSLSGVLFGFATLTDTSILYLPLFLIFVGIIMILYRSRKNSLYLKKMLISSAFFVLFFTITLSPWVYRNHKVFEASEKKPLVVKASDKSFLTGLDIYRKLLTRTEENSREVLGAIGRFFFLPHNLQVLTPDSETSDKEEVLKILYGEEVGLEGSQALIAIVKILIVILNIVLVAGFIILSFRQKNRWFFWLVFVLILYALLSSLSFGLIQQNGIRDVEPIGRFFGPFLSLLLISTSAAFLNLWYKRKRN